MNRVRLLAILMCAVMTAAFCYADVETLIGELSGDAPAPSRSSRELRAAYATVLDHLVPLMASEILEDRYEHQTSFSYIAAHAGRHGAEKEREALCKVMADRVTPATPQPARIWLIRQLELIGGKESVSALGTCLEDDDGEVREVARRALEANPSSSASRVLRKALDNADDARWRIGLINSLGRRADAGSARLFVKMLKDDDDVAAAAAGALGKIANSSATRALFSARNEQTGRRQKAITDALLDAGTVLARRGNVKDAVKLYETLYESADEPAAVRAAALGGLAAVDPEKSSDRAMQAFRSGTPVLQTAAINFARAAGDPNLTAAMAKSLPDLGPALQTQALGLLADQGADKTQPAVMAMLDGKDQTVRMAAIKALGRVATPASVDALIDVVAEGGVEEKTALAVLARLRGDHVDAAVRNKARHGGAAALRVAAIKTMAARNDSSAAAALLKYAGDYNDRIARAAFTALGAVGNDSEIPDLIGLMMNARNKTSRAFARSALASVCRRTDDRDATSKLIVAKMKSADVEGRKAALDVLRALGGPVGLKAVLKAVSTDNETLRTAAVNALGNWPEYTAMDHLLIIANDNEETIAIHILAIRGIVRLLKMDGAATDAVRLEDAKRALKAARQVGETKQVISALPTIPTAADMILLYVDEPETMEEAAQAALTLADNIRKSDRATARRLVQHVVEKKISPEITKQAEKMRGGK